MHKLIFLSNELQNPVMQKEMRLPLEFITFGTIQAKMYKHFRNQSNFTVPHGTSKRWGNDVVYGGLFLCKDFDFYARIFDAYNMCSKSILLKNHVKDIHHRVEVDVTPIYFRTLNDLSSLKYREGETITAQAYMGNTKHNKITQRFDKTASYRIVDGIDVDNFKQLFWEVTR